MKIKRILNICAVIGTLAVTTIFIGESVFAKGANGGDGGSNYDECAPGNNLSYKACFNEGGGKRGGVSWRYYTTDQAVSFKGYTGTGGDTTVSKCAEVGGFWYHGFESFSVNGNGKVIFDGYQVAKVTHKQAKARNAHYVTSAEVIGYSRTKNGYGGIDGGRLGTEAEVSAAYEKASKNMREREGKSEAEWPVSFDDFNKEYFCYSPESAAYAAKSTASVAGGSSTQTSWSSENNQGAAARKTIAEDETATITFTHSLKKEGTGLLDGTNWSVSGDSRAASGSYNGISQSGDEVYRDDTITVSGSSIGAGGSKSYCSTITYDNKSITGSKTVTSKICAEISVTEKEIDLEEATVTFSAQSEVKAGPGGFDIINENTGEKEHINEGELLNSSQIAFDSLGNMINTPTFSVIDERAPLEFSHVVTRTDSVEDVDTAYTFTILTPPSLSATVGNIKNVASLLKDTYFSTKSFWEKLKNLFTGENNEFTGLLSLDDTAKAKLGAAVSDIEGTLATTDYYSRALKLRTKDLHKGEEDSDYGTSGTYKATAEGRDYCQTLLYMNQRTVYTDSSMQTIRENSGISTGIPWLDAILDFFETGAVLITQAFSGEIDGSVVEAFFRSLQNIGRLALNAFSKFVELLGQGNMPFSTVCVKLKKAFNFNIDFNLEANKDIALVGESIGVNPNNSKIISKPLRGTTLTDTSELQVQVVNFWTTSDQVGNLNGNYTTDPSMRSNADPCTYYSTRAAARDCNKIKEEYSKVLYRDDSTDGYYSVQKTLSSLGITTGLSATVPDIEAGSLFCFAIGVKDSDSDSKTTSAGNWAISGATCRTVAKKPSLNITGGSVYSGDKITTSITKKTPQGELNNKTFGSWVEYGAVAKNKIEYSDNKGFSSGNIFHNGTTETNPLKTNPLTITNNDGSNLGSSGVYSNEKLVKHIESDFKDKAESDGAASFNNSCKDASGVSSICYYKLNSVGGAGYSDITDTHIIYSSGNITINGNIKYKGDAVPENEVPQVIIISDGTINIMSDVKQIDAWLVAKSINTCVDKSSDFGTVDFDTNTCANHLTINGPVITTDDSLSNINYRTNGSGVGADSATTAETFNLPASAYVWAYITNRNISDGYYQAYVMELPPRY